MFSDNFQSPYFGHGKRERRRQQEIAQRRQIMMKEEELRRKTEYERLKRIQRMQEQMAREEQQRRRQQEIAQRQIMMKEDELRRKSEFERRQRMQEQMAREEKRRWRMMEEERTRKAEHERRRRVELQRRHGMEMLYREGSKKEELARSRQNADSYPPGIVVRGPDGNLYRVVAPSRHEKDDTKKAGTGTQYDQNTTTSDENKANEVAKDKSEMMNTNSGASPKYKDFVDGTTDTVLPAQNDGPQDEIVVENVDDEEDEELRELRSVWRNRIPSPGQWIEPVETFRG